MLSDAELLTAWRDGDKAAGGELFERHFATLKAFFSEKADAVEDLIQQTLLACVRARERVQPRTSFRAYLLGIARRELYAHYRTRMTSKIEFDASITSLRAVGPSPTAVAGLVREHRALLHAMRELPLDLQITLELYYWEGLSTSELATALDIPHGSVKTRLRRARHQLKAALENATDEPAVHHTNDDDMERWVRSMRVKLRPSES